MTITGMSKSQLIEVIDNNLRQARIARDNGNEKAHDVVQKLTTIMMKARKLSKQDLVMYMIAERLLVAAS